MAQNITKQLTVDGFIATWLETIHAGQRDAALKTVLGADVLANDADIMIDVEQMYSISPCNIKRKWASRERGYVYKMLDWEDPDEPGVIYVDEPLLIRDLIDLNAPFRANMIEYLSRRLSDKTKTNTVIEIIPDV
ncbi:hypothetical protein F-VV10_0237 [Faustovirus]|nr:hypothetical protein F-VV10_0237 [Faustovirus]